MTRLAPIVCLFAFGCGPTPAAPKPEVVAPTAPVVSQSSSPNAIEDTFIEERSPEGPSNSPVSLTASDGTGLKIVSLSAKAVVQDPLAFTEIHLVFENPEPRIVEGQFEITLPSSASISRFAMKQEWGWQEGEVVELQAARRAYEDFLHRRQDPALLEKQPGNQFHARVFPIPPSGKKEIIISYSEAMPHTGEPYRLHLRGLPTLQRLDVHAIVGRHAAQGSASSMGGTRFSNEVVELHKANVSPDADFTVALAAVSQQPQAGLRNEDLVVARITPVTTRAPDELAGGLYVLFDTSASRALGFSAQVAQLGELMSALGATKQGSLPLKVVAFDQTVEPIYEGPMSGFDEATRAKIIARGALGASDLTGALASVSKDLVDHKGTYQRVLILTDGIATAGATEPAALQRAASALGKNGIERLDAVVSGGIRDADALAHLVTAGLPRDGVVLDAAYTARSLARRINAATVSHLKVTVPGSYWSWPLELNGVQPGDQVLVYASLPANRPLTVNLDGAQSHFSYPVQMTEVERPLIERAAVRAQLDKLEAERTSAKDEKLAALLKKQEIELSTRFRVLCDHTALLVLETEADYARFQIDRRALRNILTVGASGIEVLARSVEVGLPRKQKQQEVDHDDDKPMDGIEDGRGKDKRERDGDEGKLGKKETMKADPINGFDGYAERTGGLAHGSPQSDRARIDARSMVPTATPAAARVARNTRTSSLDDVLAGGGAGAAAGSELHGGVAHSYGAAAAPSPSVEDEKAHEVNPYTGKLDEIMRLVHGSKLDAAEKKALAWRTADPGDVLALVGLGEVYEKRRHTADAARAYGSIIDLFPGRADLRRFAGERLERLGAVGLPIAIDTYEKARAQRPDHPASHRLLAFALLRAGRAEEAFKVITAGAAQVYPEDRFRGVDRILREDVGLIAAAWIKKSPKKKAEIEKLVAAAGAEIATQASTRFVLNWETDGNDVDFHIVDAQGNHAFFSQKQLASGGELYADVTTGYGPECFTIPGKPAAYPYKLQAHYYSRGPMGYGMGKLEIIEHDGEGGFRFEERAFVIMVDGAFVDLGVVNGPLAAR